MIVNISEYFRYSRNIHKKINKNFIFVFFDMIFCRLICKIGPKYYVLFSLYNKTYKERKNYILNPCVHRYQESLNPKEFRYLAYNKFEFHNKCLDNGIPTPEILAVIDRRKGHYESVSHISSKEQLCKFLQENEGKELVFKLNEGSYGENLKAIKVDRHQFYDVGGKRFISLDELCQFYLGEDKVFIVQPRLYPASFLNGVVLNNSLSTIRIATYVDNNGDVLVLYAYIKIPNGSNVHDNFNAGNFACNINLQNGTLENAFCSIGAKDKVVEYVNHPVSGEKFSDITIRQWEEVLNDTKSAAKKFLPLRTLGWDVALTDNGVFFIETNCTYEVDMHQVAINRGFRNFIEQAFKS